MENFWIALGTLAAAGIAATALIVSLVDRRANRIQSNAMTERATAADERSDRIEKRQEEQHREWKRQLLRERVEIRYEATETIRDIYGEHEEIRFFHNGTDEAKDVRVDADEILGWEVLSNGYQFTMRPRERLSLEMKRNQHGELPRQVAFSWETPGSEERQSMMVPIPAQVYENQGHPGE